MGDWILGGGGVGSALLGRPTFALNFCENTCLKLGWNGDSQRESGDFRESIRAN